jgi:hypothetical protein
VLRNVVRRCKACLEAEGQHFKSVFFKEDELNCRGETDSKFLTDTGFIRDKAAAIAGGLWG